MKLTKRKGFNFFRSYYDVYNELESEKDKIAFIEALLDRQFLGIKPTNLKGMAKFAYISQTNSIDSQVKGYEDKTGETLNIDLNSIPTEPPTEPPTHGGKLPPTLQVEEKEEEQEQDEKKPTKVGLKESIEKFLVWYNGRVEKYSGKPGKTKTLSTTDLNNYKKLKESYKDLADWNIAFYNMWNSQWCIENNQRTVTHLLRVDNFNKYLNQGKPEPKQQQRYIPTHTILDHD